MSLKKTIQEKAFSIEESSGNRYSYKNTEVVRLNDVLGLLDEATNQIRERIKQLEKRQQDYDSVEDLLAIQRGICELEKVLSVLGGADKK